MSDSPAAATHPPRKPRVVLMISAAVVIFLLAAALLYWRWATMTEPTCVIVVKATPAWRDAEIKVDGPMLVEGALRATMGVGGRFAVPFYVDPGEYVVEVTMSGELQYRTKILFKQQHMLSEIDLSGRQPTTTPSTLPSLPF